MRAGGDMEVACCDILVIDITGSPVISIDTKKKGAPRDSGSQLREAQYRFQWSLYIRQHNSAILLTFST